MKNEVEEGQYRIGPSGMAHVRACGDTIAMHAEGEPQRVFYADEIFGPKGHGSSVTHHCSTYQSIRTAASVAEKWPIVLPDNWFELLTTLVSRNS